MGKYIRVSPCVLLAVFSVASCATCGKVVSLDGPPHFSALASPLSCSKVVEIGRHLLDLRHVMLLDLLDEASI